MDVHRVGMCVAQSPHGHNLCNVYEPCPTSNPPRPLVGLQSSALCARRVAFPKNDPSPAGTPTSSAARVIRRGPRGSRSVMWNQAPVPCSAPGSPPWPILWGVAKGRVAESAWHRWPNQGLERPEPGSRGAHLCCIFLACKECGSKKLNRPSLKTTYAHVCR